jgi:hypothetical protein
MMRGCSLFPILSWRDDDGPGGTLQGERASCRGKQSRIDSLVKRHGLEKPEGFSSPCRLCPFLVREVSPSLSYLLNLTTMAPIRSPFLKSRFGLLG